MPSNITSRIAALDWSDIVHQMNECGRALTEPLLTPAECSHLAALYDEPARFRSRVDMARHRFGEGEYQYFAAPLPSLVADLRTHLYPRLAAVANTWAESLGTGRSFPTAHADFLSECARHGQKRPTPLILRYEAGGYNCLHQDLYGEVAFPMQVVVMLSRPGVDFTGGEFLLVEQRPRAQSAGEALSPAQGSLLVFTTRERPVQGGRGAYRVNVRHGVSRVRTGTRYTMGVIFHDAT
jgi:uncharacterized protein